MSQLEVLEKIKISIYPIGKILNKKKVIACNGIYSYSRVWYKTDYKYHHTAVALLSIARNEQ